jgi:hypothetical protein
MRDLARKNCASHETLFSSGSLLHTIFGDKIRTSSVRQQGVCEPGKNVTRPALAQDHDEEGLEITGGPSCIVGVQLPSQNDV